MGIRLLALVFSIGAAGSTVLALLDRALRQRHEPRQTSPKPHLFGRYTARALGLVLVALIGAAVLQISNGRLDPQVGAGCAERPTLTHIAEQRADRAERTLREVAICDTGFAARAREALRADRALIGTIAALGVVATLISRTSRRWRAAANFGSFFIAAYVWCDLRENALLDRALADVTIPVPRDLSVDPHLASWTAAKVGTFVAAIPFVLLALCLVVTAAADREAPRGAPFDWLLDRARRVLGWVRRRPRSDVAAGKAIGDRPPSERPTGVGFLEPARRFGSFAARNLRRLPAQRVLGRIANRIDRDGRTSPEAPSSGHSPGVTPASEGRSTPEAGASIDAEAAASPAPPELGVSCSGGGIRSASFCLGALQALDAPMPEDEASELSRTARLAAVSGGSYLATAWVTARAAHRSAPGSPLPWSRRSDEEAYLRRHSNYLAPGAGGKLWALTRFGFGLATNLTLIGATLIAAGLALGAMTTRWTEPNKIGPGSTITMPGGGCARTPLGRTVRLVPGSTAILGAHQVPIVDTEVIPTPSTDEQRAKVSATVEFDDEEKATGELTSPGTLVVGDGSGPAATLEIPGNDGEAAEGGDDAPEPAPDCGRPPAAPSSRVDDEDVRDRYGAGTTVGLETVDGLRVEGEDRLFCPRASECGEDDRRSVDLPAGTLLYDAPSATLRLDEPAVRMADAQLLRGCGRSACRRLDPPSYLTGILQGVGGVVLLAGIAGVLTFRSPGGGLRLERLIRLGATAWLAFATAFWLAPHLAVLASNRWARLEGGLSAATGFGVAAYLTAIATQVAPLLRQGDAKEGAASAPVEAAKRLVRRARPYLLAFVGAIVGPLLLAAVLLGAAAVPVHSGRTTPDQLRFWLALLGPLSLILIGGDLNSWSLHSFYRARLQSAFAVDRSAMRRLEPGADRPAPGPDPLPREDALASLVDADPELLVCAAVNLADDRATAPGRPVASWVFSPTRVGSAALGGARGFVAPDDLPTPHLGSAWTAVAVSGAAFSPAMGKMSRPERSILAIANLRLGLWYPNPLYLSDGSGWFESHRNPRPWYLAKEMIGLHRASDRWVYVSDGGHYENLGLVELLRSGCREIYCFDAAGDTTDTFGTFSDAARLARAELGVEIELEPRPLEPGEDGLARTGVVAGWFRVPADGDRPEAVGWIVLAKLVIPRTAPHDIADLARTVPGFPTNPTSDQLFTDQKFEAYRALGDHLGTQAAEAGRILRAMLSNVGTDPDRVRDAVRAVNKKLQGAEEAPAPQAVALSGELALRQAPS